ncbi:unnamed protein product [Gordionus sp. m RMFG-2023]
MGRIKNLKDLKEYERGFEILIRNGSILNCTLFKNLKDTTMYVIQAFEYLSVIIFVLGIIGNSLGLYFAMKDKIVYIRVYLTRVFHAVNLVNYIFMLIYPVVDINAEFHLAPFRNRIPWNNSLVHYHFTLAKTFVNFSFGVYIIFAISQMIAIIYPYSYKYYFTRTRTKIMLAVCFLYYLAWYIPSSWWFEVSKVENICGFNPKYVVYARIFAPYKSGAEKTGWIIFGFFRETFTRFLPVSVIVLLNYLSIKRKKEIFKWRSKNNANTQDAKSVLPEKETVGPSDFGRNGATSGINAAESENEFSLGLFEVGQSKIDNNNNNISAIMPSDIVTDKKFNNLDQESKSVVPRVTNANNLTANSKTGLKLNKSQQRKRTERDLEYKISIRMMAILMMEFLVFLFPVSIYIISVDFFDYLLTTGESDVIFAGCTLLEYSYISLNFYLNIIFNPTYREDVCRSLKKSSLVKFIRKRGKNSVDIVKS